MPPVFEMLVVILFLPQCSWRWYLLWTFKALWTVLFMITRTHWNVPSAFSERYAKNWYLSCLSNKSLLVLNIFCNRFFVEPSINFIEIVFKQNGSNILWWSMLAGLHRCYAKVVEYSEMVHFWCRLHTTAHKSGIVHRIS